jgi:hypothetical protein
VVLDADWPALHHSQLVPSAVDVANGRMHVLFEGLPRAVDAQLLALGGEEAEPWEELRTLQAGLPGRVRWDGQDAPLVRPGPRVAYAERAPVEAAAPVWSPLAVRVLEAMCSPS